MIISKSLKKAIYLVPKTGSKSLFTIIKKLHHNLDWLDDDHINLHMIVENSNHDDKKRNMILSKFPDCFEYQYYSFLRDPIKRALSGFNHLLRTKSQLKNRNNTKDLKELVFINDLFEETPGIKLNNIQKGYLPLYKRTEHREYFKNLSIIDVLEKFKRTPYLITFEKQYNWCSVPNSNILNYADFENELKRVYKEFGGDSEFLNILPNIKII